MRTKPRSLPAVLCATLCALAILPAAGAPVMREPVQETTDAGSAAKALEKGDFQRAVTLLEKADAAEPGNADILSMLGYAHRKLKQYDTALAYYLKALDVDARHRPALEYLGELYVEVGETAKAEEQLAKLEAVCGTNCEEYKTLKAFLAGTANDGSLKRLY